MVGDACMAGIDCELWVIGSFGTYGRRMCHLYVLCVFVCEKD